MAIMIVLMVQMSQLISVVIWMELGSVHCLKFPVQSMMLHAELINFNVTVDSAFLVIYNALESLNVMMNLMKSNAVSTKNGMLISVFNGEDLECFSWDSFNSKYLFFVF